MARANKAFFVKLRKEINEDNTPPTADELLEVGLLCAPGREPQNSLAYKLDKPLLSELYSKVVEDTKEEEIRIEAIRTLVTEMIAYAERFPYEQNEKAEVVKEVLYAKSVNGFIPHGVLDEALRERLNNLGRKEQHYQIKSLVEVSGNDKVILGGLGNG